MNRVVYPKEKELTVMAQKKKDGKMMGKIIKTAVSGVLCVALAGGIVAANVLIPPNASSVQSFCAKQPCRRASAAAPQHQLLVLR